MPSPLSGEACTSGNPATLLTTEKSQKTGEGISRQKRRELAAFSSGLLPIRLQFGQAGSMG